MKTYVLIVSFLACGLNVFSQEENIHWVVGPVLQLDEVQPFSEGLAFVNPSGVNWRTGQFIDKKGNVIIQLDKEDRSIGFKDGVAFIENLNSSVGIGYSKWRVINKRGTTLKRLPYHHISEYSEGLASVSSWVGNSKKKEGYIDENYSEVIPLSQKYETMGNFCSGRALVKQSGKYGYIDKTGKLVIPLIFDDAFYFSEGLAWVKKRTWDTYGCIDTKGNVVIPPNFEYYDDFSEGFASIEKDDKVGFINKLGEIVIPCIYDDAYNFKNGYCVVEKNDKTGMIDKLGNVVVPIIYDNIRDFSEGLVYVEKNDKIGYVDRFGNIVIPLIFRDGSDFSEGVALVEESHNKWGIIRNPLSEEQQKRNNTKDYGKLSLVWLSPNIDDDNNRTFDNSFLSIKLRAIGNNTLKKSDFKVFINGNLYQHKSGETTLNGTTFTTQIKLKEGKNHIQIKVGNNSSSVLTANYTTGKPNLYVLAIAPNFNDNTNSSTLQYTDDDARDIVKAFGTQKYKGVFKNVNTTLLTGNQATASAIQSEIEKLKMQYQYNEIMANDVVLVFISSHGFINANEYFIKGDDYNPYSPTSTSVSSKRIMSYLNSIKCKKLLFIDACYSGGTSRDDVETQAINQTIKALTNQQKGIVTFSSSTGSQKSYEHSSWENGAFTYAITQALSGKADYNYDHIITINELDRYLKSNVPKLVRTKYNEIQTPQMFTNGLDGDLPIFVY